MVDSGFDRLAFAEVLSSGVEFNSDKMAETYKILGMDESETTTLEEYMEEYFSKILKKLKEAGGESRQRDFICKPPHYYCPFLYRERK